MKRTVAYTNQPENLKLSLPPHVSQLTAASGRRFTSPTSMQKLSTSDFPTTDVWVLFGSAELIDSGSIGSADKVLESVVASNADSPIV